MKCENCAYYWSEPDDLYSHCHWEERCPGDKAPCEYDEREEY